MAMKISSREDLNNWLRQQPPSIGHAIAIRASLRVFPVVFRMLEMHNERLSVDQKKLIIYQIFKLVFLAWISCRYETEISTEIGSAAVTAARGAARAANNANLFMTAAYAQSISESGIIDSSSYPSETYGHIVSELVSASSSEAVWTALSADCNWLEAHNDFLDGGKASLNQQPLWLAEEKAIFPENASFPQWVDAHLDIFHKSEIGQTGAWEIIADWFSFVANGSSRQASRHSFDAKTCNDFARLPESFWHVSVARSPDEIMDEIADITGWKFYDPWGGNVRYDRQRFGVIRVSKNELWDIENYGSFPRSKFLDHTSTELRSEFQGLGEEAIAKLLNMPVVFAYTRSAEGRAKLGHLNALSLDERHMHIGFEFDPFVPPIAFDRIEQVGSLLGISTQDEYANEHWSIKQGDLYSILAKSGIVSVANPDGATVEKIEIPPQEPAPIETAVVDDRVVRVHSDHATGRPDLAAIHSILLADAAFLAERLDRQAKDAAWSLQEVSKELGESLDEMRIYGVGYWAGVLNQISARIEDAVLEDAAGRFAGFLTNLNLFLRHSDDWNGYVRTAQQAELDAAVTGDNAASTKEIVDQFLDHPDVVSGDVSGPLEALNKALLDGPMYNPETVYGFYRSLANVLQAVAELVVSDGVDAAKSFASEVGKDIRKLTVSFAAGAILTAAAGSVFHLANALPTMFGFLHPILRLLGIG